MCQMMAVCRKATKHFYERKLFYDWISCEASGTLPGCAVSHCWASSAARHCSAALPNAPLRFLRHWRRSASHTPNPLGGSRLQAAPLQNKKPPFRTAFSFWWGIRDFTRLCRAALLRVFRRTALLCGTAQCSASLSPPPAALSFAYPEPARRVPASSPPHCKTKSRPFGRLFLFGGASGT